MSITINAEFKGVREQQKQDYETKQVKTVRHLIFDAGNFEVTAVKIPDTASQAFLDSLTDKVGKVCTMPVTVGSWGGNNGRHGLWFGMIDMSQGPEVLQPAKVRAAS